MVKKHGLSREQLEFRNDDVLQVGCSSLHHVCRLRCKTAWEWFLEADKVFEEYNYPCTLVILSEGIDYYPEWVEYIKKHQYRYNIELHGSSHRYYENMTAEEGYKDLLKAKEKIEKEFNVKITTWYIPYGKRHFPKWGEEVCKKLGINFDVVGRELKQHKFHYWHKEQVEKVHSVFKKNKYGN